MDKHIWHKTKREREERGEEMVEEEAEGKEDGRMRL